LPNKQVTLLVNERGAKNTSNNKPMKKIIYLLGITIFLAGFSVQQADAQSFIKKLKKKAEDAAIDKVFEEETSDENKQGNTYESSDRSSSPTNTKGGGLNAETIDVNESIADAEAAFNNKEYGDARYSIRQAIQGIELEIGENILNDLPEEISEMKVVTSADKVTSTGIGFVGLIIERTYRGGDQELKVEIGNDAGMLSAVNMYLSSGAYGTTSTEEQNYKRIKFQGHNAIIEYDEYTGYKLSVPFGQSSILVINGVNFNNEDEFMDAASNINLENIKNQLGEQ
jgi:hypothetical protein